MTTTGRPVPAGQSPLSSGPSRPDPAPSRSGASGPPHTAGDDPGTSGGGPASGIGLSPAPAGLTAATEPAADQQPVQRSLGDPHPAARPGPSRERRRRARLPRPWRWRLPVHPLTLASRTASRAWGDRILGLSAEAGFWQLLSLPPLLLAILGTIGYFGDAIGQSSLDSIEASLLRGAGDLLTPSVVDDVVKPTVDEILRHGRPDVISIGFVLSLWTGSAAMATYVNTITIAYGQRDRRSAVRSRLLALRLYLAEVVIGVVLLPGLVLGPGLLQRVLGGKHHHLVHTLVTSLFWPVAVTLSLAILTSLYHLALPDRLPWRRAVPGAVLAVVVWVVGSYGLRVYLQIVFGNELVYGSLGAPVAVLLFFYITALAVLLGAEMNATLDLARRAKDEKR